MSRSTPVLEVAGLRVRRGIVPILDGVDWRVMDGEHWAILGPNGSGKTSLLAALTGYLMPTEGEIVLLGERYGASDWRELRRRIGMVGPSVGRLMNDTEPALATVVSGRYAMIDYWGRPKRTDTLEARRLLEAVELPHAAARPWAVLSQGERQRVLIARALMASPRLLILDEPCAGLDPVARERFLRFVDRLVAGPDAPTLVLVTHHVEEISPAFSHALLLAAGRVVASGPARRTLTSASLSAMFGEPVRLGRSGGRRRLTVPGASGHIA
jgi:iron complex transport system ATP-binding protein